MNKRLITLAVLLLGFLTATILLSPTGSPTMTHPGELDALPSPAPPLQDSILAANPPTIDQAPTCADLVDTDNIYSQYDWFGIRVNVTDLDGYADIDFIDLYGYTNDRATKWWTFRYDEDIHVGGGSNAFSETYDPNNYVSQTSSSAERSGNKISAKFNIRFHWEHPYETDIDLRVNVSDSGGDYDDQFFEVNWDIENRTEFSVGPSVTSDDAGTVNRGDLDETFYTTGTVDYYGSALHPPGDYWDIYASTDEYGSTTGPFADTAPHATDGTFNITCYADDVVGLDNWIIKPVGAGKGAGGVGLNYTASPNVPYISDRLNFTCTVSESWVLLSTSIDAYNYANYEYDGTAIVGSITWSDDTNGTVSYDVVTGFTFKVTSFSETTHGLAGATNVTATCIWDDIEITSGPAYFWVQYSVDAVWLIWGAPTSYAWGYNTSAVQNGVIIQSQMNGTDNAYASTYGGSIAGLSIGAFNTAWYYVNISIRAQSAGYDWIIWTKILEVEILHTIYIENFNIEPTDYYFWITYQSNWNNASITIWDDAINAGTSYSDAIYWSASEGMHQFSRSTTIASHNISILINGTATDQTHQTKDYSANEGWWWYNFTYVVTTAVAESPMRFAFFNAAGNWIPFESLNVSLTYQGTEYVLTSPVATVGTALTFVVTVRGRWGEVIYNSTTPFAYTQFKAVTLPVHQLTIENEADHPVRVDISYNYTYPNITIMVPTRDNSPLYLLEGNYTIMFTYYAEDYVDGIIINYNELSGAWVSYNITIGDIAYLKYTGIPLVDINTNILNAENSINNNVDGVDSNVSGIRAEVAGDAEPLKASEIFQLMMIAVFIFALLILLVWGLRALLRDRREGRVAAAAQNDIEYEDPIHWTNQ
ncbi:MAG: PulJ/GspJ family protein [Candidatus Thorarchaeota archaeon]|jgi:hypothetical protein